MVQTISREELKAKIDRHDPFILAEVLAPKVATAQGPMLVTFTQKVAELDLLLEPGDRVELITPGYATFVEDPTLERVKKPAGAGAAPPPSSTSSSSPQGSQEKTGR